MSTRLYRAERCRDLADECCAIAALSAPLAEKKSRCWRVAELYSELAAARELGMLGSDRHCSFRQFRPDG
jgi:hypothetical protein